MARPTRFCAKCGEYVTEKDVTSHGDDWRVALVHINDDGTTIYRNHAAVEDDGKAHGTYPRLP